MMNEDERINAQLTKYFEKVITNTANNYYKKKREIEEKESLAIPFEELVIEPDRVSSLQAVTILNIPIIVENRKLEQALGTLKEKEQVFLIEKFIFEKTDKEIGKLLGFSRQGVTNLKLRLYDKFRRQL
jgi:RNA polymerase sigma factor (sigma-70 family)